METQDIYVNFENKFDRITYQNDIFFWVIALIQLGIFYAGMAKLIPVGNMGVMCTVLAFFALSWVYTNARRRLCGRIKAIFFAVLAYFHAIIGGIIYFIFRPKKLVITSLPPSKLGVWPVFDGPVMIFARAPFRLLMKFALWGMGLAFLLISILDIFGKV